MKNLILDLLRIIKYYWITIKLRITSTEQFGTKLSMRNRDFGQIKRYCTCIVQFLTLLNCCWNKFIVRIILHFPTYYISSPLRFCGFFFEKFIRAKVFRIISAIATDYKFLYFLQKICKIYQNISLLLGFSNKNTRIKRI